MSNEHLSRKKGGSKRVALVTGGGGFIGQALLRQLLDAGWHVRNLDFVAGKKSHENLTHWQGSFTNKPLLHEAMFGVDCIFHLASTHFPQEANAHPLADAENSILGIISMTDMAKTLGVRRLVFASSGGTVYGNLIEVPVPETHPTRPITAYGISKLASEHYLRFLDSTGIETISLRIANPYGPEQNINKAQGALTTFCHHAVQGLPISIWGDGTVERDFVYVDDVARAFVFAADSTAHATEINIGSGQGASLNSLLDLIRAAGCSPKVEYQNSRSFDVPHSVLNIERAQQLLDWAPQKSLKSGVQEMIETFQAQL